MKTLTLYIKYWSIRIFFLIIFLIIAFGSYFYSVPQLTWGSLKINNLYYTEIESLPGWLYGAEYFIFTFIITSIILFVLIVFYKRNKRKRKKIRDRYEAYFATALVKYLYEETEYNTEEKKQDAILFKKALKDDYAKRIFISTLRKIRTQTIGEVRDKTLRIYDEYYFDYLIRAYLHAPYLRKKLFALKVISDFQLTGYESYIIKLAKRNNNVLHSEALVTLVKLNTSDNLLLLAELKIKLTIWDINVIVKTVLEQNKKDIDYLKLINPEKPEVCALGIMLARLNQRKELKMDIRKQIGNSNELVNDEAFLAFVSFVEDQSDFDFLINKFEQASENVQISIIKVIASHPDKSVSTDFLKSVVENKSFILKLEALQVLMELDLSIVAKFKRSENKTIRQICAQVLDLNL